MLAVLKNKPEIEKQQIKGQNLDIIVIKKSKETIYNKDGTITIKPKFEKVNITKKINETAKLIKEQQADERVKMIEDITTEVLKGINKN